MLLLPERISILPGHYQDNKRREEEQRATDGSQQPLATLCQKETKQSAAKTDATKNMYKRK